MRPKVRGEADNATVIPPSTSTSPPRLSGAWWGWPVVFLLCAGVFVVFAAATVGVTWQLRKAVRQQLVARDAEILQAIVWMEHQENRNPGNPPSIPLTDSAEQAAVLLRATQLKGVLAVRLFDTNGQFVVSFPPSVRETRLGEDLLAPLRRLQFLSRFYEQARLEALFIPQGTPATPAGPVPLLEVFIPLSEPDRPLLLGIAQFYLDGQPLLEKYRAQDRHLASQALVILAVGALVIFGGLGAALRHLQKQHQTLVAVTERLARANQELTLAAKTSAVGAVAAHLIHGLKSPLYGLHNLLLSGALGKTSTPEPAWQAALETTRQLQQMIQETARLLQQDTEVSPAGETRLHELLALLRCRLESLLNASQVKLHLRLEADARLSSREAALVALILENLLRNAIQASHPNQVVELQVSQGQNEVLCTVRDQGPGLPETMRSQVFAPCVSTKPGGMGIGLAISKQLANHLGARLELASTSPAGTVFTLALPLPPLPLEPPHR